ncbi:MAG: acyl-ACP--UDP-N-acetylglucosamine O-acyltransferase [Wenzhouxiangella sp.]|jgi:UDP-N-acetylglucosamine acyltransferase|nr:acyl-ACP--UDP-N-acetylglucosamine O-acyltransferase [Wenzhouxiangella sp.]
MAVTIHPTAIIESGAQLGQNVTIGAYSVIESEVVIGDDCVIGPHVVVSGETTLGQRNRVFQFASIGAEPQDKKYRGERSKLVIGDDNTIRESVTINRGSGDGGGLTTLGDHNWIMAYCHIAHDCHVGSNVTMANGATLAGHVHVGDHVIFAGFSGAHQFCKIGDHAFLGMYGGVTQDVPAYVMVSGQPPRPRGINSEGLKRHQFSDEQIRNIKEAYRVVYRSGLQRAEALDELQARASDQPEIKPMIDWIQASERGLCR